MREGRWTTVTASQFAHEREALQHIQTRLPDAEPYRAWSNFTFTADTGHVREVDLFVAAPGGLYLVEVKSLHGRLYASGSNWIQRAPNGRERVFDNPLHLAESKARQLRSLLTRRSNALPPSKRVRIPFIQAAVFLSVAELTIVLPDHQLVRVFGPEPETGQPARGVLPPIVTGLLGQAPREERDRVRQEQSKALTDLLRAVGIACSRRHFSVGAWQLAFPPFDTGPTWQDHHATHAQLSREHRRVRIYLVEREVGQSARDGVERAARREMMSLHGISHPGIVQVDSMESHEAGPALVFRHDPQALRLDHFLARFGDRLDALTRLDLVRQLAEAMRYAHGRHLHHRALSARSILVTPAPRQRRRGADGADAGDAGDQDARWLAPHLQISDWQAATRGTGTEGSATPSVSVRTSSVGQVVPHLERAAVGYLAPELTEPAPDAVALDVFGLGTVSYLILTGQPPATSRLELSARLEEAEGLRPAGQTDAVSALANELVWCATRRRPVDRFATVSEFVEYLSVVEEDLTAPTSLTPPAAGGAAGGSTGDGGDTGDGGNGGASDDEPEPDPLETRRGDLVGGEWRIAKRLGTGSTSRAFLAHNVRTDADEVLKVALSEDKAPRLEHEARVLRGLADSRIIRLARQEPIRVGGRTVLVLAHAGERTVARKLRDEGRLTVDELETFSDYLFGAADYLDGEGVTHRDLKPDNIAIKIRKNRSRQLVLIDFSLAGISVQELEAGTPRYLDPFLGPPLRPVYAAAAERYALAVTLHEMASAELPVCGATASPSRRGRPTDRRSSPSRRSIRRSATGSPPSFCGRSNATPAAGSPRSRRCGTPGQPCSVPPTSPSRPPSTPQTPSSAVGGESRMEPRRAGRRRRRPAPTPSRWPTRRSAWPGGPATSWRRRPRRPPRSRRRGCRHGRCPPPTSWPR